MELKLLQTNDPAIIEAIGRLRMLVWHGETNISFHEFGDSEVWIDELDRNAFHWVVYHGDELVASARLSIHQDLRDVPYAHVFQLYGFGAPQGKIASINRLVVAQAFRGLGVARALDRARLQKAAELGATTVLALPVGEHRRRALAHLGYVPLAIDLDPTPLGVDLKNAKVSLMTAPLLSNEHVGEFRGEQRLIVGHP